MAKAAKWLNAILDYMKKVKLSISMGSPSQNFLMLEWLVYVLLYNDSRYQKANMMTPGQVFYTI